MSSIVMDKETIFTDELIRENARLTIQHEADHERILALINLVKQLEQENSELSSRAEQAAGHQLPCTIGDSCTVWERRRGGHRKNAK